MISSNKDPTVQFRSESLHNPHKWFFIVKVCRTGHTFQNMWKNVAMYYAISKQPFSGSKSFSSSRLPTTKGKKAYYLIHSWCIHTSFKGISAKWTKQIQSKFTITFSEPIQVGEKSHTLFNMRVNLKYNKNLKNAHTPYSWKKVFILTFVLSQKE